VNDAFQELPVEGIPTPGLPRNSKMQLRRLLAPGGSVAVLGEGGGWWR
jgi:hypothetical protein